MAKFVVFSIDKGFLGLLSGQHVAGLTDIRQANYMQFFLGARTNLDGHDLGRHLGSTFRERSSALAAGAKGVLGKLAALGALPLGFRLQFQILRSKFLLVGLH